MDPQWLWIDFRVLYGETVSIGVPGVRYDVVDDHIIHP